MKQQKQVLLLKLQDQVLVLFQQMKLFQLRIHLVYKLYLQHLTCILMDLFHTLFIFMLYTEYGDYITTDKNREGFL